MSVHALENTEKIECGEGYKEKKIPGKVRRWPRRTQTVVGSCLSFFKSRLSVAVGWGLEKSTR